MWQTDNTRLAAALLALGRELDEPPFDHRDTGTVINFVDGDGMDDARAIWRNRTKAEPLSYMFRCADAYEWLINKVLYGPYEGAESLPRSTYVTRNLHLVCALIAENFFLLAVDRADRRFVFCLSARELEGDFAARKGRFLYMRNYLERFDWLKAKIKESRLDSVRRLRQSCAT